MTTKQPSPTASSEAIVRRDLARLYRMLAYLGMDDLTYTHLSARHPEQQNAFLINPFGLLFDEITPDNLIVLDFEGHVRNKEARHVNKTGYRIHGDIYRARPDVMCAVHLHTEAGVAVSAMQEGLLPLSQFALHFYERTAYHAYNGLVLDPQEGHSLAAQLGHPTLALFLQHHGTLTLGTTIQEAFFYTYYLEKACKTQLAIVSQGRKTSSPPPDICRKARDQMRAFEPDLGCRDWAALMRRMGDTPAR